MGRKDASTARTPVDQYRKQIGKQDYKKTRPMLRATRLKAEAKKTAIGVKVINVSRRTKSVEKIWAMFQESNAVVLRETENQRKTL
uniref:Triple QxxK/R motif-containing protein n=1 Tax=Gallus gallus TaxID=9031 RepID=A0A8V0Y2Y0_CHICK